MAFFSVIARFVARRPLAVVTATVGVGLLLGLGMIRLKVVTNVEDLYTPQGNIAFVHRDYVDSVYGYDQLDVKIYVTGKGGTTGNVLTKDSLLALLDVYNLVISTNATFDGSTFSYDSDRICYRPAGAGTPCQAASVLDSWDFDRARIEADNDVLKTFNRPYVMTRFGQPVPQEWVIGQMQHDNATGKVTSANALLLTLYLQNHKPGRGSKDVDKYVEAWQKAVTPVVKTYSNPNVDVFILSPWEQQAAADSALTTDLFLQGVSAVLLVGYSKLILHKPHPVYSQSHLSFANFISVGLAVLGSYGLCSLFGLGFSLVTQSLALLLLGLGTDDMLVTLAAHDETRKEMAGSSISDRIVVTVARARRGVIVAAATNFVAFCTGISSQLPALRDFMIYAAVGVILVFIYQTTFFVACLTLDLFRQRENRMDVFCCVVSTAGPNDGCCRREYDPDKPDFLHTVFGAYVPKVILHPVGKIVVLLLTAGLLAWGVYGAVHVRNDFNMEWLVPKNAYVFKVFDVRRATFPRSSGKGALPVYAFTRNPGINGGGIGGSGASAGEAPLDYFNNQDELAALGAALQSDPYVGSAPPVQSWYDWYIKWLRASPHKGQLTPQGRPPTSALFYEWLHEFLASLMGRRFQTDVVFAPGSNGTVILSSRMFALTNALVYSQTQVDAMVSTRQTVSAAAPSLQSFAYSYFFIFFEGYAVLQHDTVLAVAIAGAVVFVIMLLVLADLTCSILVAAMVAFIGLELVGFLYWSGMGFNSVTSITVLLSVGIVVDYSAFIAFSFLSQVGSRNERARKALAHLGVAVFNGGFFMFLAVLPMCLAQSFVFQSFFKMFAMIVSLGLWHGLFALPVILSLVGPRPFDTTVERLKEQEEGGGKGGFDGEVLGGRGEDEEGMGGEEGRMEEGRGTSKVEEEGCEKGRCSGVECDEGSSSGGSVENGSDSDGLGGLGMDRERNGSGSTSVSGGGSGSDGSSEGSGECSTELQAPVPQQFHV
ncbi:unnamed protein product [Closterium sp. Naga37s-1]|nr:unnamed protein product [Closterium sp. Naga37s-1]